VATAAMSVVIAAGKAAGLLETPPPKQITARAAHELGIPIHAIPQPAFTASWVLAHAGYGAATGVLYALSRPLLPKSRPLSGLLYGGAVWGISYLGVMPKLGLYPTPDDDRTSRSAVMIAAHAVYGTSLSSLVN
jgi:hypothetical protein